MKHTKLAISILTYNRPQHIKEYLHLIAKAANEKQIMIYIFDGSERNGTEKVVTDYIDNGYTNIVYDHRHGDNNFTDRYHDAFYLPEADYIWVCGDKFMICPVNYERILYYIENEYDVIIMYHIGNGTRFYTKAEEYFRDCAWCMTHLCSTVIKKDLLSGLSDIFYVDTSKSFKHMNLYANALDREKVKAVFLHINSNDFVKGSLYSTTSGSQGAMLEIWNKKWYDFVVHLPKRYQKYQKEILISLDQNMHWYSIGGIYKIKDQLTPKKCWEYREYITNVMLLPLPVILLISCLPKWLVGILNQVGEKIKKVGNCF